MKTRDEVESILAGAGLALNWLNDMTTIISLADDMDSVVIINEHDREYFEDSGLRIVKANDLQFQAIAACVDELNELNS